MQALRTATSLKRGSCETCQIFKNTLFYWTSPVAPSDSFRFPVCNFIKKDILAKMFFFEFCKISKNIFWQNTSGWLLLKFIGEFWEVFQKISFIEHSWETAYFKYKLQYLNQQILWKTISQVLLKYFMNEKYSFQAAHYLKSLKTICANLQVYGKTLSHILLHVFCIHFLRTHHDYFLQRAVGSFFMVAGEGMSKNVGHHGWPKTKN